MIVAHGILGGSFRNLKGNKRSLKCHTQYFSTTRRFLHTAIQDENVERRRETIEDDETTKAKCVKSVYF